MERQIVLKQDLLHTFRELGVEAGQTVMVHCSLSSLGFVCGGPQVVIEALMEAVGPDGTIMMPTQSWKNLDPSSGVHWEEPEEWWQLIRENWPAYDKAITPTNTMGAVAEMFRRWPGTLRSDHPARSVAAWGRHADYLTRDHDLSNIFGEDSPIGKLYESTTTRIPRSTWQTSEPNTLESTTSLSIARSLRTAFGSGSPTRRSPWTERTSSR